MAYGCLQANADGLLTGELNTMASAQQEKDKEERAQMETEVRELKASLATQVTHDVLIFVFFFSVFSARSRENNVREHNVLLS